MNACRLIAPSLVFLFFICVSGCAQRVSTIQEDLDLDLDEQTGYLLIGIETESSLHDIRILGQKSLILTSADLRQGTQYILIDIPAGDYAFDRIRLNYYWHTELTEGYWDFAVSPGIISYVGHLNVDTKNWWNPISAVALENRSTEALVFLQEEFPIILQSRQLRYEGPGEDGFLEYVEQEGLK